MKYHCILPGAVLLAIAILLAGGCAGDGKGGPASRHEFSKSFNQITPGTSGAEVENRLGSPDSINTGTVGIQPTGPRRPRELPAGSRYQHWVYVRGDSEYHVFLRPGGVELREWEVISVSANPVGAPVD